MQRWPGLRWIGGAAALWILTATLAHAQPAKTDEPKKPAAQLPVGHLDTKDWLKHSIQPIALGEIDRLVNAELAKVNIKPAPLTTDEQFIRRIYLDLTGKLPTPADISEFVSDKTRDKRAKLVDKLLASEEYCLKPLRRISKSDPRSAVA